MDWLSIETAPKTGILLLLLVVQEQGAQSSNPTEDDLAFRTIGHNNFDNDGEDRWQFAGWNWENDYWTEGRGNPIKWMPFPVAHLK